MTRLAGI